MAIPHSTIPHADLTTGLEIALASQPDRLGKPIGEGIEALGNNILGALDAGLTAGTNFVAEKGASLGSKAATMGESAMNRVSDLKPGGMKPVADNSPVIQKEINTPDLTTPLKEQANSATASLKLGDTKMAHIHEAQLTGMHHEGTIAKSAMTTGISQDAVRQNHEQVLGA